MVKRSKSPSRRGMLLAGASAAGSFPMVAKAQFALPDFGDLPEGLGGFTISPPIETDINPPVDTDINPSVVTERLWDAVAEYVKEDTELLAPKVAEYVPNDPPMPHMKSTAFLEEEGAVYEADLERSNTTGMLQAKGQADNFLYQLANNPYGFILNIPAGLYKLTQVVFSAIRGARVPAGPRLIFRGQIDPDGNHPILELTGSGLQVRARGQVSKQAFASVEIQDLEMKSASNKGDGGPGQFMRFYHYDNVLFSQGFKNCNHPSSWPGVGIYNNCAFTRSGKGDGLTHSFYGSYVQSLVFRNCLFTSPLGQGHPAKLIAQNLDLRGCTIANWWHQKDFDERFFGEHAPTDIGAWGQTFIQGCHFIRRGAGSRTRAKPFIDFRNRLFEAGANQYRPNDFGTDGRTVDYHDIDNEVGTASEANPADSKLYRHVILDSHFFNGILPDGDIDPAVERRPGFLFRNQGTIYRWSNGEGALSKLDPNYEVTPTDYSVRNERSVLYVRNNNTSGVTVAELYPGPPGHTSDPHPVVELGGSLPAWVQARVDRNNVDDHWWDDKWPSVVYPGPEA